MGLPAENLTATGFDPSLYYERKPVLELFEGLGLGKMVEAGEKYAPKFWGIDTGLSIAPTPDDMRHKLLFFSRILIKDPRIDSSSYEYANKKSHELKKIGERALRNRIVLQKAKKGGRQSQPKVTTTFEEALLLDPEIMEATYKQMLEEGDSVAKTIATLEDWRLNQEEHRAPSIQQLRLGFEAYEIALLGYRKEKAQSIISQLAISRHVHVAE